MSQHPSESRPDRDEIPENQTQRDPTQRNPTQRNPTSVGATPPDRIDQVLRSAVGPETLSLLADLDPSALPGAALVRALLICQSLASWVDATEQSVLAALSRPGVAVPVERVIDAARWSAAKPGELAAPDRVLEESTHPLTDPRCREAVAHHAARFAAMEVAAALHLSPLSARIRVERARQLVDALPNTHAALLEGRLDLFRATLLADDTALLTPEIRRAVESEMLDGAELCTPAQLRARVARTVLRLDPDGAADRCRSARRERDVYARPLPNDLSAVTAIMGAEQAASVMWLLNFMADAAKSADDPRGVGERRVDALADMVEDIARTGFLDIRQAVSGPDTPRGGAADAVAPAGGGVDTARCARYRGVGSERTVPVTCLTVYVAASTLVGADDLPAELAGYGAISPDLARALARSATTARTVVIGASRQGRKNSDAVRSRGGPPGPADPQPPRPSRCYHSGCSDGASCGTSSDLGRSTYGPSAALAVEVVERDRICRFPGCRMAARRCDLDHRIAFDAGGPTCPCNLQALCRAHHLAKTFTGWASIADSDGTIRWTSPLGFRYADHLEDPTARLLVGRPEPTAREANDDRGMAKAGAAEPEPDDEPPF